MILDAKEGGVVYRELIPEYLDDVRTVSEGKQSWHSVVRLDFDTHPFLRSEYDHCPYVEFCIRHVDFSLGNTRFACQLLSLSIVQGFFLSEQQEDDFLSRWGITSNERASS